MDPSTLDDAKGFCDREFEKEAWLSMVMLEWGTCGQTATIGGKPAGSALYAPPRSVPRASTFPTSPAGADAVLLTSLRLEPIATEFDLGTDLVRAVVRDLVRRGVRALEAFGIRTDGAATGSPDPLIRGPRGSADCGHDDCMIDASFLERFGFDLVAPHDRFPRFRLELDGGHEWKEDVESALDQLLHEAAVSFALERERVGAGSLGAHHVRAARSVGGGKFLRE
nr:GNAT family N-acetyltransferase [Rhodococcus sp. HNM0569]